MSTVYDLDALRRGRGIIAENIENIEMCLIQERNKLAQYDQQIAAAEAVLRAHGVVCLNDAHDWEVVATFPDGRSWKKRSCRKCPTKQKLGD